MATLIGTAGLLAVGLLVNPAQGAAQAPPPARLTFDVASIKPSASVLASVRQIGPDSLTYTNRTLLDYIRLAYGVESYQISRGPAVSLMERYDIVAKAANPVPESQVKRMLQTLLEDRFKLALHRESKELAVFVLTVAKGGPRFKASADTGPMNAAMKDGALQYTRTSMAYLAGSVFSNLRSLGRPVLDRTQLDGVYDFSLQLFDPDAALSDIDPKGDVIQQLDNGLSASLKNLGLKLEAQKSPVEIIVIDHVERPSEN